MKGPILEAIRGFRADWSDQAATAAGGASGLAVHDINLKHFQRVVFVS
jgi:hypothetical protein